jgi:AcrR family transcriptional regulator
VYRHFPTKEALFQAVIVDRLHHIIDDGYTLLKSDDPGEALFTFLLSMVLQWGAADRGLVDALAGLGIGINNSVPEAEDAFLGLLGELLSAAQESGTARKDVGVPEVKALLVGTRHRSGCRNTVLRLRDVTDESSSRPREGGDRQG